MNKKGFTLVELLAVLVVLAIIMVIAGVSVTKTKKEAAYQEALKLERSLEDMGANIYSYEMISGIKTDDEVAIKDPSNPKKGQTNAYREYFYYKYKNPPAITPFFTQDLSKGFRITLDELHNAGYAKNLVLNPEYDHDNPDNPINDNMGKYKIPNPYGGKGCNGYILVTPTEEKKFRGFIRCPNGYSTKNYGKYDQLEKKGEEPNTNFDVDGDGVGDGYNVTQQGGKNGYNYLNGNKIIETVPVILTK